MSLFDHYPFQSVSDLDLTGNHDKLHKDPLVGGGEMRWKSADSALVLESYPAGPIKVIIRAK